MKFYAAKSEGLVSSRDLWAVWGREGRNRVQLCVVTCGGRKEARNIANALNKELAERDQ